MANNYFWHNCSYFNQIRGVAVGVKYAPSVTNLLLSQWREKEIFGSYIPEMTFYKRYIDDPIVLWECTEDSLIHFLENSNKNAYGLKFTGS